MQSMENLPADPAMLLSYINMKLRDEYDSLDALCDDLGVDREALVARLAEGGFEYSAENKRFW